MMLHEFLTTIPVNGENREMSYCLCGAIFFSVSNELRSQTGAKYDAGLADQAIPRPARHAYPHKPSTTPMVVFPTCVAFAEFIPGVV